MYIKFHRMTCIRVVQCCYGDRWYQADVEFVKLNVKLFVDECIRKFNSAETVKEAETVFNVESGFLYSLSFVDELKCRVKRWRAIMDY